MEINLWERQWNSKRNSIAKSNSAIGRNSALQIKHKKEKYANKLVRLLYSMIAVIEKFHLNQSTAHRPRTSGFFGLFHLVHPYRTAWKQNRFLYNFAEQMEFGEVQTWSRDCAPPWGPTGHIKRPPFFNWLNKTCGVFGDAAPTWITSYGAYFS